MKIRSLLLFAATMLIAGALAATEATKPNVLLIFADDMSYEALGAAGVLDIDTPNLDRLAKRGVNFTHAYNMGGWNGAICVASRTMLNTGKFIWSARAANLDSYVGEHRFWSQRMKQAGYRTYMTGKWHVSAAPPEIFDVAKHIRAGMPKQVPEGYDRPKDEADYEAGWKPWDTAKGGFWEGGKHWSEVVGDDGVEFLEQATVDDHPFFMYLAFNAPHDPRQAPKEYVDRYPLDRIKMPESFLAEYPYAEEICGKNLRDEQLMPYPRTEYAVKVNRQEYFAIITHMDDQIGRILDALEKTGKADNTYIVFSADHGLSVGHHGLVGKQNQYDHSVRVPFLMVGPTIEPGSKIDTPIYLQDLMATSLDLAGAPIDGVDFKSLLPLLDDASTPHYDEIYGSYIGSQRMLIKGDWKLIAYPTAGVNRLFNLVEDPMEMNDLAGDPRQAAKLKQLLGQLEMHMDYLGDPMSTIAASDYAEVLKRSAP
jgi:arylsulfatase A-like enzyme